MKTEILELNLPSRLDAIDRAAAQAARVAAAHNVDEAGLFGIDLAVREAVANAVKHGNQFDETKTVKITFETTPEQMIIQIEDQGAGFNVEAVPDPTAAEHLLSESGRGILFMRNFMDEASWTRRAAGGTIVRLTKKF